MANSEGSSNSKLNNLVAPDSNTNDIVSLVNVLQQFCKLLTTGGNQKPPKPDVFSADIFQDPEVFLQQLETHLKAQNLTPAGIMKEIVSYLDGEAAIWYEQFDNQIDTFDCFSELFLERYNTDAREDKLREILFGHHQHETERAVPFLLKKKRLCNRLYPNWTDKEIAAFIRRQLQPQYRILLGPHPFETTKILREACTTIDEYIHEDATETHTNKVLSSPSNFVSGSKPNELMTKGPPCRYCPDTNHWHRHCPIFRAEKQSVNYIRHNHRKTKPTFNPLTPSSHAIESVSKLQVPRSPTPVTSHSELPVMKRPRYLPSVPQRSPHARNADLQQRRSPPSRDFVDRQPRIEAGQPTEDITEERKPEFRFQQEDCAGSSRNTWSFPKR